MKKTISSVAAFILCCSMVLSSAACSKKKAGKAGRTVLETDTYYRAERIELPLPKSDTDLEFQSAFVGDAYVCSSAIVVTYNINYVMPQELADKYQKYIMNPSTLSYEEGAALTEEVNRYDQSGNIVYNLDGSIRCTIPYGGPGEPYISRVFEGNDGKLMALIEHFGSVANPDMTSYTVEEITETGELVHPIELESGDAMFHDIAMTADGGFICTGYREIMIFDANGKKIASDSTSDDELILQRVYVQDGTFYALFADYSTIEGSGRIVRKFDPATGKFAPETKKINENKFVQGNDGVYYLEGNNVEKIDLEACQTAEVLFSWNDVDVNRKSVDSFYIKSKEELLFVQIRGSMEDPYFESNVIPQIFLVRLTKEEKNPHAGKSIIQIASSTNYSWIPDVILDRIVEYNLDPEKKTRIEFVDYSSISTPFPPTDTDEDTVIAQTVDKVYLDMMAGAGPDILLNFGEYSQFDNGKILLDLNNMIDGENGLNREEYFDNVLRACEKDGHLYQMPINFMASGMVANKTYLNGKASWSYDDFQAVLSSLPSDMTMIQETTWAEVLKNLLYGEGRTFIDFENKTLHFDDPKFLKILEIVKAIGSMRTEEEIAESNLEAFYMGTNIGEYYLKQGMTASAFCRLIHILEFAQYEAACEDGVTFIGNPGNETGGFSAEYNLSVGISANSTAQKEAWDFVRFLLEKDTQCECVDLIDGFPIRKDACEAVLLTQVGRYEKSMATPGVGFYYDQLKTYPVLDSNTVQRAMTMLGEIHSVRSFDKTVFLLIKEETEGYILGNRSAEDVAKNIQNRAATVINERG
ncbi:MAG: carbohydrate ABC transporter substrate-binding protein [Clostridiales bacterium]|nr:carbohydrate ABC transporter substrate-binding protein [Clostridiales bacterium]